MSFTYNPETSAGQVRLLCTDAIEEEYIFEDDEIGAFLVLEDSSVRRAAALALETLSTDEARVMKKIEVSNLKTDGPALAKELRERARSLREQADLADARDGSSWDYAELAVTDAAAEEIWWNQALRGLP